jgi:hypothetical protein
LTWDSLYSVSEGVRVSVLGEEEKMNSNSKGFFQLTTLLLLTVLLVSGCQLSPALAPTYTEGIYYQTLPDPNQKDMAYFGYIQLYKYGVFTFFGTSQSVPPSTVVSVYESIAVSWLVPDAVPYHTGNYVILGSRIYLNYPAMGNPPLSPAYTATGTYTPEKITYTELDGSQSEYLRYPPANGLTTGLSLASTRTVLGALPLTPAMLNNPLSCLTGTWRVDTAPYIDWMNKVNTFPTVKFTNIDPPFYYVFNADGTGAIYAEKVGLYFDAIDPKTGKSAGTFETISTGIVNGSFAKLDADPAYPGASLITFNILGNSVKVIDIKYNGASITGTSPDHTPLINSSYFAKVAYTCDGDTLSLLPKAAGLPEEGFTFTRDNAWKP